MQKTWAVLAGGLVVMGFLSGTSRSGIVAPAVRAHPAAARAAPARVARHARRGFRLRGAGLSWPAAYHPGAHGGRPGRRNLPGMQTHGKSPRRIRRDRAFPPAHGAPTNLAGAAPRPFG